MKRLLVKIFIVYLLYVNSAFAAQTPSEYFVGTLGVQKTVTVDSSGTTTATIQPSTGALNSFLKPSFIITTNSSNTQNLTFSASANTSTTTQNAIFNISTNKYIILTNSNSLPPVSSLTDIKTGTPTGASNPNAIAYSINDPAVVTGLTVTYNATNKNWDLSLTKKSQTPTSVTIPAASPLSGTFSGADLIGDYQATITLTFN